MLMPFRRPFVHPVQIAISITAMFISFIVEYVERRRRFRLCRIVPHPFGPCRRQCTSCTWCTLFTGYIFHFDWTGKLLVLARWHIIRLSGTVTAVIVVRSAPTSARWAWGARRRRCPSRNWQSWSECLLFDLRIGTIRDFGFLRFWRQWQRSAAGWSRFVLTTCWHIIGTVECFMPIFIQGYINN